MKKVFSLFLLSVVLGVFAVGCGGPAPAPPEQTTPSEHSADAAAQESAKPAEHAAK
ncbi:MAG: hypothetical protein ACYC6Y_07340 [Thermoguttaceae bacterium]